MRKEQSYSLLQRVLAFALVFVMVAGYIPVTASADQIQPITTVADPETLGRPESIYGANTLNAGKITVGKSVQDENENLGTTTITREDSDNFLVTVSQTAQVAGLTSESAVPVDVVFVIDTSGSMDDNDRAGTLVKAANSAIDTLMEANEANRIGVVAFSSKGYGEGSSNGAAANVLSSLKHYTGTAASNHLTWTNGVYIKGQDAGASRHGKSGGTNIQAGVALGAKMLTDVTDTTWINPETGAEVNRIPFLIVLSDGQPTFSYSDRVWYDPSDATSEVGPGSGAYEGSGFITALTAAYYKGKITEHYYGDSASVENHCYVYTIGVEIDKLTGDSLNLANITLDPATYSTGDYAATNANSYWNYGNTANDNNKNSGYGWKTYWEKYQAASPAEFTIRMNSGAGNVWLWTGDGEPQEYYEVEEPKWNNRYPGGYDKYQQDLAEYNEWVDWREANFTSVSGNNYPITVDSINATRKYVNGVGYTGGIAYNDGHYNADDVSELEAIFKSLLATINEKAISSPTKVTTTPEFSGYVTFTDPIGEFMEVKDIKGIYANGRLYAGGRAAEYLNGTYTTGADAFFSKLRTVLKERLTMTDSQNVDALVNSLISGRQSNQFTKDNSITWWGSKIAGSDESHVQCLGYADVTNDNMTQYIQSASIPTFNGITPDTLCRSYLFYGTASGSLTEEQSNHDYMYFMVRIQQDLKAPYQQTVVISTPASLLSVDEVMITENEDGTNTAKIVNDDEPARVIYEVGLRSDINPQNVKTVVETEMPDYAKETGNMIDGQYQFYTNDWDREASEGSHHRAQAKATFNAALDNPFYAYQENELIYVRNGDGTYSTYVGTETPSAGTYYYQRTYYDWAGATANTDGTYNAEKKVAYIPINLSGAASGKIQKNNDNTWYITRGTYTASSLVVNGEDIYKSTNNTGSASIVSHPHRTETASDSHYTVLLGNNGRLSLSYDPPKSVYKTDASGNRIEADGKAVSMGETLTYQIEVENSKDTAATAQVIDYIPAGTTYVEGSANYAEYVELKEKDGKQYLEWNLPEVPANGEIIVSFQVKVAEDVIEQGISSIDNTATVSINNEYAYTTNTTTNPPEGKASAATDNNGGALDENAALKVGDQLTYTIRYANDTDATATVTVTDTIPAGTTYKQDSASSGGVYNAETGTITWTIENVPAGLGGTVTFAVYVNASARVDAESGNILFENTASIKIGENDPRYTNTTTDIGGVGDITLKKTIRGIETTADVFTLILSESAGKLSGTYAVTGSSVANVVTFVDGVGRVQLKADETVTVKGLPLGATISVVEDTTDMETWKDTYQNDPSDEDGVTVVISTETGKNVDVTVNNEFIIIPVTFQLSAVKNFAENAAFPEGTYTFGFKAQQCDENGSLTEGGRVVIGTATKGEDNTPVPFTFTPREFTQPTGPLYYLVSEDTPQNLGVIGDDTQYLLKLVIENEVVNGETTSNLIAKTWYKKVDDTDWQEFDWKTTTPFEFENTYPANVTIQIPGTKELTGRFVTNGEFSFELLDEKQNVIANTAVVADGTTNSGSFTFPRTYSINDLIVNGQRQDQRTFTYYIRETNKGEAGMTYDGRVYQVEVTLKLENGVLTAAPTITLNDDTVADAAFTNEFQPEEVAIRLHTSKTVEGDHTLTPGEFTFSVYETGSDYKIANGAQSVANGANAEGGSVDLGLLEYVPNDLKDASGNYQTKTFYYVVKENIPAADAPTFDPGMFYDEQERHFSVTVSISEGKMTAVVSGAALVEGTADNYSVEGFTNHRVAREIEVTPVAQKTTTGTTLPDGLRFSFAVRPATVENGMVTRYAGTAATGVSQSAVNGTPVDVDFTKLVYNDSHLGSNASATYYYVIEESNTSVANGVGYDQTKYVMQVTLSRNAESKKLEATTSYYRLEKDGSLTNLDTTPSFTNTYDAEASVNVTATKTLTGRTPKGGEFDFRLQRLQLVDGSYVPVEGSAINGTNDADGSITFGTINFVGTGLTKESTPEFEYVAVMEDVVVDEATGATESRLKEEYWLVRYQMSEIKPDDVPLAGVQYDGTVHTVTVKLYYTQTDENSSELHAKLVNVPEDGYIFKNIYTPQGEAKVTISAKKTLTGRSLKDGEFAFNLYRVDDEGNEHFAAGATNDAKGNISFTRVYNASVLQFPQNQNTYAVVYHLTETPPTTGGVSKVSGDYYVKVVITHDTTTASYSAAVEGYYTDKACTQSVTSAEFVNEYIPAGTSFTPAATKELLDKDNHKLAITKNQFSFTVKELDANGNLINAAAGTGNSGACPTGETSDVTFTPITVSTAGEHYYEIAEVTGTNAVITYTNAKYYVKATVVDDGNGRLHVDSVTYHTGIPCTSENRIDDTAVRFTNRQGNGEVDVSLDVDKTVHVLNAKGEYISTYNVTGGEYDFGVYEGGELIASGTNDAAGSNGIADILFENITITLADMADADGNGNKVFTYTVKEIVPSDAATDGGNGVVIDNNPITVKVTIHVDDYNNLSVTNVEYEKNQDSDDNLFVNTFKYEPVTLSLSGTKGLNGKELAEGEFKFKLSGGNLTEDVIVTNGSNGTINFGELPPFLQPGTFTYTVEEIGAVTDHAHGTYQTDPRVITVVVTVTADANGKLHAVPMYYSNYGTDKQAALGGIAFSNLYIPEPVQLDLNEAIDIIKTITNESGKKMDLPLDGFQFELVGITGVNGNKITGVTNSEGVVEFNAVTFTDDATYTFYIRESNPQTNKPGYVMDPNAWMVEVTVSYNGGLEPVDYTDVEGQAATAGSGELYIKQGDVKVTPAGSAVQEVAEASVMTAAEGKPAAVFTNVYKPNPGEAVISVTKSLEGRDLRDGEFTFRLMQGARIVAEATNTASGTVTFRVPYTGTDMDGAKDGSKTFHYTIVEVPGNTSGITYDVTVKNVTVTVKDDNGTLAASVTGGNNASFTNSYTPAKTEAVIEATKYLDGRDLLDNMFTFLLTDTDGKTIEAQNAADGSITFAPIEYTAAGVYKYTLSEKIPVTRAAGDMTYDESTYTVTVTVTDDLNGKLHAAVSYSAVPEFHNRYEGIGDFASIAAKKTLSTESNRTMKAGDFTFELVDADGNVVQTKTNDADGNITFDQIPFDTVGAFKYTIREVKGDEKGMTYDENTYGVTVNVVRQSDGNYKATVVYDDDEVPTFTNTFVPEPVDVTLEASKELDGRNLKDGEFTFALYEGEKKLQTASNKGSAIIFDPITYTEAGVHTYTMQEVKGSDKKMTYDEKTYTVTVTVTDTDGVLSTEVVYEKDDIVFRNTYNGDPAKVSIGAKKRLDTSSLRLLKSGEFSFQLLDENGKVLQTKTNTIFGNVNFDEITYNSEGEFKYTIKEVPGTESGMTYDKTEYEVIVTVTKDMTTGNYEANVAYKTDDGQEPTFINTFKPLAVKVNLTATKNLTGRALKDGEFKFTVYDSDGKKQATGTNDAKGKITFEDLTFSQTGVYKFTVKENKGMSWYMTYDRKSYEVTVTVTETDGVLKAEVTYPSNGITFRNVYDPSGDILPQTGDDTPLALLLGTAVASGIGLVMMFVFWRKGKKRKA